MKQQTPKDKGIELFKSYEELDGVMFNLSSMIEIGKELQAVKYLFDVIKCQQEEAEKQGKVVSYEEGYEKGRETGEKQGYEKGIKDRWKKFVPFDSPLIKTIKDEIIRGLTNKQVIKTIKDEIIRGLINKQVAEQLVKNGVVIIPRYIKEKK